MMDDSRYNAVLAAIREANQRGSEFGGSGHELQAHVFLAALDAAMNAGQSTQEATNPAGGSGGVVFEPIVKETQ